MEKLAIDGGKSVREKPFPSNMLGASLIGAEELAELTDVVHEKSPFRHYGVGNPVKVKTFEEEFCKVLGCKYALAVSSGSGALLCAIAAAGLGPGDEVIIPSFAWYTDYCVLVNMGVMPVFADIGEDLNMDPADFERKITKKTKAVIPVHYQGAPAKIQEITRIARAHNLVVIEDCAQALGGEYRGKMLGSYGDMAIASFQTHKMITCGEGGMFFTNNEELYVRAVRYHDLGFVRPFFENKLENKALAAKELSFPGLQMRMSELQGAFILAQIRKLGDILAKCRAAHAELRAVASQYPRFSVRYTEGDCGLAFIMLMKDKTDAERLTEALVAEGIPCGPTSFCCNLMNEYPIKSKAQANRAMPPFGKGFDGENVQFDASKSCPNTDGLVERFVAIGLGPLYGKEEVGDIAAALDKVCSVLF
ncbi:MAG: DegT/DnrJ/EryC1/StrS family aminotransferase [Clostridiaceae bacterium]